MRWFYFGTDGVHDLPNPSSQEATIAMAGAGTAQLGYIGPDGLLIAFTDAEATLTDGVVIVCAAGASTDLRVQITGADATTAIGVASNR